MSFSAWWRSEDLSTRRGEVRTTGARPVTRPCCLSKLTAPRAEFTEHDHRSASSCSVGSESPVASSPRSMRMRMSSAMRSAAQVEAIAAATERPNVRVGIIPWTTPVRFFPRHGFHLYDEDAVIVGTETATATMTGAADIATYVELFTALEASATFGDAAAEHLARIAGEYQQLTD
jgi:hypothetical protein